MAACEKVTSLKFKKRVGVVYDNDWVSGVEYQNKNEDCIEEYHKYEYYIDRKIMKMKIKMMI